MPDPRLEAAYRATDYVVDAPAGRIVIHIDEIATIDADSWAFLTACNPMSVPLTPAENDARMTELERLLVAGGHRFGRGAGVSRVGDWPPEPSFLVFDIEETSAVALARGFDQAAIVFARRGEPARLVWVNG